MNPEENIIFLWGAKSLKLLNTQIIKSTLTKRHQSTFPIAVDNIVTAVGCIERPNGVRTDEAGSRQASPQSLSGWREAANRGQERQHERLTTT